MMSQLKSWKPVNAFIEFLTLKNMGVDTEISFLTTLEAEL